MHSSSFSLFLLVCVCSLAPLVFLIMAPKVGKFVPFKNPISRHAFAYSTPPYIRFCDSNSQKDFDENFSSQAIHFECHVILSDFLGTMLPESFRSSGWESLCGRLVTCLNVFIQELYSNICVIDTSIPQFSAQFRCTHIIVIPELISEVL